MKTWNVKADEREFENIMLGGATQVQRDQSVSSSL